MRIGHILLLFLFVFPATMAAAVEQFDTGATSSSLTLQGFGTLGIARSDNDRLQYVRDLSQPAGLDSDWSGKIDSVLGLQAGYRFNDKLEGVIQTISRYRHDSSWRPEISWAFLRYEPGPDLNVRVGRLGTEFYMLADSRMVGYANLTVRPPPDYFGPMVFSYLDGLDASLTRPAGNGLVRVKLFAGISPETTPFVGDYHWDLYGTWLAGGYLGYETGPWQVRYNHTEIRFNKETPLAQAFHYPGLLNAFPALALAGTRSHYDALGLVYDQGPLQFQLMLNRLKHDQALYEDSRAGYAIASYRLGKVRPYLGYSQFSSKPTSALLDPLGLSAGTHADKHAWFLGARWDVRKDLDLKAQMDWVHGSSDSMFTFRYDPAGVQPYWDGDMKVFSLALDFIF